MRESRKARFWAGGGVRARLEENHAFPNATPLRFLSPLLGNGGRLAEGGAVYLRVFDPNDQKPTATKRARAYASGQRTGAERAGAGGQVGEMYTRIQGTSVVGAKGPQWKGRRFVRCAVTGTRPKRQFDVGRSDGLETANRLGPQPERTLLFGGPVRASRPGRHRLVSA